MEMLKNSQLALISASLTCGGIFDLATKEAKVKELEKQMEEPDFWLDSNKAQRVIAECTTLRDWTVPCKALKQSFEAIKEMLPEAAELDDEALLHELTEELDRIDSSLNELEVRKMLSGELDSKNCYLSINAGAGGTEACDWVLMLARMYHGK